MKLELKHLAPYLPYGLKFLPTYYNRDKRIDTLYYLTTISNSDEFGVNGYTSNYIKPILRPLSDLTKEIEHNGEKINIFDRIEIYKGSGVDYLIEQIKLGLVEVIIFNLLLEHHFDVFGLIEQNLAIDINTLNK